MDIKINIYFYLKIERFECFFGLMFLKTFQFLRELIFSLNVLMFFFQRAQNILSNFEKISHLLAVDIEENFLILGLNNMRL